jgi:hypothetical protein
MPDTTFLEAIPGVFSQMFRLASITAFNRLEASPRTQDFSRSLRAEVRDPLWMLTRQWQMGEFKGDDAATPVGARILSSQQSVDRVAFPTGAVTSYDDSMPIETRVENEALRGDLGLAVEIARAYWKLDPVLVAAQRSRLMTRYALTFSPEANDIEGVQLFEIAQTRWWHGFAMLDDMRKPGVDPARSRFREWLDTEAGIGAADKDALDALAGRLVDWFKRLYSQPASSEQDAWKSTQLEYGFTLATPAPQQHVLVADEYYQGHVDWYSFDLDDRLSVPSAGAAEVAEVDAEQLASFIPAPISFKGMPHPRFWQMEENQTDFGAISASTTALLHIAFAEFGLIYANDWFMLPFPMPFNSLCEVQGIVVTDVFGQETLVRPAGRSTDSNWQQWRMFHHTDRAGAAAATNRFYLPSSLTHYLESEPIEKVNFLRDEAANMVWAVENTVPSLAGPGVRGDEMEIGAPTDTPFVPAGNATIRYVAGTTVPRHWIPFLPVHIPGSTSEIRLQRATMPGALGARGRLLTEQPAPFFVNEEEVPRAGVIVQRSWQRARWVNGQTYLWVGRYKEAGRGEGHSDLKFDQVEDLPPLP